MKETDVLTRLLINPDHVFLVTGIRRRRRWLTDRYVMFDITEAADAQSLDDGEYKLTRRGFTGIADDSAASVGRGKLPSIEKLTRRFNGNEWLPLHDTPWLRPLDLNGLRFAYLARLFYAGENGDRQAVLISAAVLDAASEFYDPQRITVETALMEPASEEAPPTRIARVRSGRAAVGYLIPPRLDGVDEDALRLIGEAMP
jgi:hypothetical protein